MASLGRRQLLKLGAACAAVPIAGPAIASITRHNLVEAIVVDTRFAESDAFARGYPGLPRLVTDGDATQLWYDRLDLAWRAPGGMLAGVSGEDLLFVLETLAHDRGRKVLERRALSRGTVQWLIGMRG